jgi:ABC-type phosphonate transport system ATPase subunit
LHVLLVTCWRGLVSELDLAAVVDEDIQLGHLLLDPLDKPEPRGVVAQIELEDQQLGDRVLARNVLVSA